MHRETFERDYGTGGEEEAERKKKAAPVPIIFLSRHLSVSCVFLLLAAADVGLERPT